MPLPQALVPELAGRCKAFGPGGLAFCFVDLDALAGLIEDHGEDIVRRTLSESEAERYFGFRHEKRRREFLGGRLAAKQASRDLLGSTLEFGRMTIEAGATGRPSLALPPPRPEPDPEISITHSGGLAGAMASHRGPCGIDVQAVVDSVDRVREKFLQGREARLLAEALPGEEERSRLTILWAAKEAIRKTFSSTGIIGFLEQELVAVGPGAAGGQTLEIVMPNRGLAPVRVRAFLHGQSAVAFCHHPA